MENKIIIFLKKLWLESISPTIQALSRHNKENSDQVRQAIEEKTDISVNNFDEAITPLLEAQNATTEAVRAIPVVSIPELDISSLEAKLEALLVALKEKEMTVNVGKTQVDVDTKGIIKAIEKLHKEMPKMKPQEVIDYTLMFDEMMTIMERPKDHSEIIKLQELVKKLGTTEDLSVIAEWLKVISEKEAPEFPDFPRDKDGYPIFTPSKVGGGGGGGLTSIETGYLKTISEQTNTGLATSEKQDEIIAAIDPLSKYKFADLDDDATPNYYGAVSTTGAWYILKEDTTAKTLRYATGASAYTTAWTGRVALSYDYLFNCTLY